jgi:hypothetical protein
MNFLKKKNDKRNYHKSIQVLKKPLASSYSSPSEFNDPHKKNLTPIFGNHVTLSLSSVSNLLLLI